jgi:transposase InsO family protein
VTFKWIHDRRGELDVALMCRVLGVSRAGYYAWATRRPAAAARGVRRAALAARIRVAHASSRHTYGSPRVTAELQDQGVAVCENTVAKYMRQDGLSVRRRRRFVPRTTDAAHPHPVASNVLGQQFAAARPNEKWACDLTYIGTGQGWLYLWVVLDLFSRRIVGWSMTDHTRADGAAAALTMAIERRRPRVGAGLLHHSDRGVQYACAAYRSLLAAHGIASSMSRRGNCYDNACVESFFATLKGELVHRATRFATHAEARSRVFEWIECWYNRRRRHSSLGHLSPEAFEARLN